MKEKCFESMNEQEIIVGIVMLICIMWVIRRTILCIKRIRRKDNPCEGCSCDCHTACRSCSDEKK